MFIGAQATATARRYDEIARHERSLALRAGIAWIYRKIARRKEPFPTGAAEAC